MTWNQKRGDFEKTVSSWNPVREKMSVETRLGSGDTTQREEGNGEYLAWCEWLVLCCCRWMLVEEGSVVLRWMMDKDDKR